jgi:anhydro-N-acetylmuramic acid kinase
MNTIISLGIMSGTSLDGVDLALCRFLENNNKWQYEILDSKTISYPVEWELKLRSAHQLNVLDFLLLHNEYGIYLGLIVNEFLEGKIIPDIISSHGHTIFHQPDQKFTFQLGSGASISATTQITTISDFRTLDVAFGGQGAPLVPIGDKYLFHEYDYCLNLGGFANISFEERNNRIAFDICPVNLILNKLAFKKNKPFDKDGEIGASGRIDQSLLGSLNSLDYYKQKWPKSLGREWVDKCINPLLADSGISIEDQVATFYEHIASQILRVVGPKGKMLCTGGGTKNKFLVSKLEKKTACQIIIPEEILIDFKEALIFAFLGVLRFMGRVNCLSSVTGARLDNIGGIITPIAKKPESPY